MNFTFEGLDSAKRSLVRLRSGYQKHLKGNEEIAPDILENYERRFHEAINDDLNMPKAMGVIWELIKFDKYSKQIADLLLKFDEVLGIRIDQKRVHREQKGYIIKDTKEGYTIEKI